MLISATLEHSTIVHVNRQNIAMNAKDGGNRPVYIVRQGNQVVYAREVIMWGSSRFIYNGGRLKCGARAWLQTDFDVELIDPMTFADARKAVE